MVRAGRLSEAEAGSAFSIATTREGYILGKVAILSLLADWQQVILVLNNLPQNDPVQGEYATFAHNSEHKLFFI